jgi:hypothetical protein
MTGASGAFRVLVLGKLLDKEKGRRSNLTAVESRTCGSLQTATAGDSKPKDISPGGS